ncbi:MAG: D-tyrosyl-tRNA(Tyr) deacylase [Chloroflexi bacterium]|nr:D-tyrosyl-tRNA(Tyr) deacylase [Chloroflexota bacterium]
MRAVLQRVTRATVTIDGEAVGAIGPGLLVLLGVAQDDGPEDARRLATKTAELRIFADAEGRFNRSLLESDGAALVVSQFTLLADVRKGRRPSFVAAAAPEQASPLVDAFAGVLRELGVSVATGRFGAHMLVALENDGPVTIVLDTVELDRPRRQKRGEA